MLNGASKRRRELLRGHHQGRKRLFVLALLVVIAASSLHVVFVMMAREKNLLKLTDIFYKKPSNEVDPVSMEPPANLSLWYRWGRAGVEKKGMSSISISNTTKTDANAAAMSFSPILEALVLMDSSPSEYYNYDVVKIADGGILYHSLQKVETCLQQKCMYDRYKSVKIALQESLCLYNKTSLLQQQPRFQPLYKEELVFFIRRSDSPQCETSMIANGIPIDLLPSFQWCSSITCLYTWPIVSYSLIEWFYNTGMTTKKWIVQQLKWKTAYPWKEKIPKAFWRGSCTGPSMSWRTHNMRVRLVRIGNLHSDVMDFGLTGHGQIPSNDTEEWLQEFGGAAKVPFEEQQQYKAIVDIDGNAWSSRFSKQLCFLSVTIKVEPSFDEYFYSDLQPWVHYVPVDGNLSNLVEIVQYVLDKDNDAEMHQIVQNANEWCARKLTKSQLALDLLWMMVAYYEALDRYDPKWRQVWRANSTAYILPHLNMTKFTINT